MRVCSRDSCKPSFIKSSSTVKCIGCRDPFHLQCYGIDKPSSVIFVNKNVVFLCDACLTSGTYVPSPKRKLASQTDCVVTQDINSSNLVTPSKAVTGTTVDPLKQLQESVDRIISEVSLNSNTLQVIHTKINNLNNTEQSSVMTTHAPRSYASVLSRNVNGSTGRSNISVVARRDSIPSPKITPAIKGASSATIGKPLTPRPPPKKSIWISQLHRDTTEDDITKYVKSIVKSSAEFTVRKLVKKDREISSYSFVSFRVTCSLELFELLMNAELWPASVNIREFEQSSNKNGISLHEFLPKLHGTTDTDIPSNNKEQLSENRSKEQSPKNPKNSVSHTSVEQRSSDIED